jgi:hypothetical protein
MRDHAVFMSKWRLSLFPLRGESGGTRWVHVSSEVNRGYHLRSGPSSTPLPPVFLLARYDVCAIGPVTMTQSHTQVSAFFFVPFVPSLLLFHARLYPPHFFMRVSNSDFHPFGCRSDIALVLQKLLRIARDTQGEGDFMPIVFPREFLQHSPLGSARTAETGRGG